MRFGKGGECALHFMIAIPKTNLKTKKTPKKEKKAPLVRGRVGGWYGNGGRAFGSNEAAVFV